MGFGGGQNENSVPRRFLQGLEQGIEGVLGEHVRFIDDDHLVAAFKRRIPDFFVQFPDMVDAGMGGAVDLGHINRGPSGDLPAVFTLIAGLLGRIVHTVQGLGQNPGQGRLADPPGAAEEIRRSDFFFSRAPGEDLFDLILPHHLGKGLGAIGRCQVPRGHGRLRLNIED